MASAPEPEGVLPSLVKKWLGPSWKTSLSGDLTVICGTVVALEQISPGLLPHKWVALAGALGMMLGGVGLRMAKDKTTTGAQR
jgi:hypothetical protein